MERRAASWREKYPRVYPEHNKYKLPRYTGQSINNNGEGSGSQEEIVHKFQASLCGLETHLFGWRLVSWVNALPCPGWTNISSYTRIWWNGRNPLLMVNGQWSMVCVQWHWRVSHHNCVTYIILYYCIILYICRITTNQHICTCTCTCTCIVLL